MITENQCKKIIDAALAHARGKVDGIEVTVSGSDVATSRFAMNGMTQNQSPVTEQLSVRVLIDGKQARLTTDQTSPKAIRAVVDNAILAAKLMEKDEELQAVFKPAKRSLHAPKVNRFDAATARLSAEARAEAVKEVIEAAKAHNLIASGVYATGSHFQAIGNSASLFVYHKESSAECSITMTGPDSSGWSKARSFRASDIDVSELALRAALKAKVSADPQEVEPGKYTVILEPAAVLDLVGFLWGDFTGTTHTDKLSCLLDKVGSRVFGTNINIVDDVYHPLQSGAPFDGEGIQRKPIVLVENGVLKNLVHGRRSALKFGVEPTGHGFPEPSAAGEYPLNVVVGGGNATVEQMIAETDRGILLTRVWYVREVDRTTLLLTGLTQDGTFLIENGSIKCGIKNMRFNVSILEMLNNVLSLGESVRTAGEEAITAVVPAMKVAGFNFTERTLF